MATGIIKGGRSFTNGVAFATDRHIATARLDKNGEIHIKIRRLSKAILRWKKYQKASPRLLNILVSVWIGTERLGNKLLLMCILMGICDALWFHINSLAFAGTVSTILVGCPIALIAIYGKIKPFHAAEHKAFNAYTNTGSTNLDIIAKQDRFSPKCGTSFFAPLTLVFVMAPFLGWYTHIHFITGLALLLEATLVIDMLLGWHKIPVFKHFNHWLQLHVTTSEPNTRQLAVAKAALDAVIAADKNESRASL